MFPAKEDTLEIKKYMLVASKILYESPVVLFAQLKSSYSHRFELLPCSSRVLQSLECNCSQFLNTCHVHSFTFLTDCW
jgi:hypothetical protein